MQFNQPQKTPDLKQRRSVRIALYALLVLFALACLTAGVILWKYHAVQKADPPVTVLSEPTYDLAATDRKVTLGTPFMASAEFSVPWSASRGTVSFARTEGVQQVSDPVFEFESWGWGANRWRVFLTLQTYCDGAVSPGTLTVDFASQKFEFKLPEITSVLPDIAPGAEPKSAGVIEPKPERPLWIRIAGIAVGIVILVFTVLAIRDLFFRKKLPPPVPFWESILSDITKLREAVKNGSSAPEYSIASLTHIVRRYLEIRFSLRAERQTTAEFLADLEKDDSPLSDNDRRFLKKFLVAADMIKYARITSDSDSFDAAAVRAEKLIRGTAPQPETKPERKEADHAGV